MRLPLLFLFILLNTSLKAQYTFSEAPLFVRGKILSSFIFIENNKIRNITIGVEKQINNYHSFGIDFIGYHENGYTDIYDSLGQESGETAFNTKTRRKQLLIDYRFYFTDLLFKENKKLYLNIFYRRGKSKSWKEKIEVLYTGNNIWHNESIIDYGATIGMHFSNYGEIENYGIDINIGLAKRFLTENYETYIDENTTKIFLNQKSVFLWPIIRLNLYFNLYTLCQ